MLRQNLKVSDAFIGLQRWYSHNVCYIQFKTAAFPLPLTGITVMARNKRNPCSSCHPGSIAFLGCGSTGLSSHLGDCFLDRSFKIRVLVFNNVFPGPHYFPVGNGPAAFN